MPPPGDTGETVTGVRRDLAVRLPAMIESVLAHYRVFTAKDPPGDPKAVAAYYGACRAALGHVEQLHKLARWLGGDVPAAIPGDDVDRLIARAEAALEKAAPDR